MLHTVTDSQPGRSPSTPPIIEFTAIGPDAGTTHLLYLLTALAVLPAHHGGSDGCVVIIDADQTFSITRLAQQIKHQLAACSSKFDEAELDSTVHSALYHVYIHRPHALKDMVDMISDLPEFLLQHKHRSFDRSLSFVAIDSVSAFYWQSRVDEEDAAFLAGMPSSTGLTQSEAPATYSDLRSIIESVQKKLHCPFVLTARHRARLPRSIAGELPRALRPTLPASIVQLPTLRFMVRRVPVRKVPNDLTDAELAQDHHYRSQVPSNARFECIANEFGLNAQAVNTLRDTEDCFWFRIGKRGLSIEPSRHREDI